MGCFDRFTNKYVETNGVWQDENFYLHIRPAKAEELFKEECKNGKDIDAQSIENILQKMEISVTNAHLKKILEYTDINKDNRYDLQEFKQLFYAILNADPAKSIMNVIFFCYDKDESGNIDRQEFDQICKAFQITFTEEELNQIFASESEENPKVLYIQEFDKIMKKKMPK